MRPRFCYFFLHPLVQRAQGKPDADRTRGRAQKSARVDHRATDQPGFPRAMVYGLLRAQPGETSSVATVALRIADASRTRLGGYISTRLDASVGRQADTTCPSAPASAKAPTGPRAIPPVSTKT